MEDQEEAWQAFNQLMSDRKGIKCNFLVTQTLSNTLCRKSHRFLTTR